MLIYRYTGKFGLGDMIRSIFAFYTYCEIHKIPFMIYLQDHPIHKFIYDCKLINDVDHYQTFTFIDTNTNDPYFQNFLRLVREYPFDGFVIVSNVFDFVSWEQLHEYKTSFKQFLQFKKPVLDAVQHHYTKFEDDFTAIHVRCGDAFQTKVNCSSDKRIEPAIAIHDIKKIKKYLEKKFDLKVLIFSDNYFVKAHFPKHILDTNVGHPVFFDEQETLDSIVEFILLGFSAANVVLTHSGFSFWSSFIYNVPLYIYDRKNDEVREFFVKDLKY